MKRPLLLVNATAEVRDQLAHRLGDAGFDVAVAADGFDGMRSLHEHAPCWVLLDIAMPVLDGFEFLASVRNIPFPPRVFVVTSVDSPSVRERAARLGAEQFFTEEQALHPNFADAFRDALGLPPRDPSANGQAAA